MSHGLKGDVLDLGHLFLLAEVYSGLHISC